MLVSADRGGLQFMSNILRHTRYRPHLTVLGLSHPRSHKPLRYRQGKSQARSFSTLSLRAVLSLR